MLCPDGSAGTPTPRQQALPDVAQALLKPNAHFAVLKQPTLHRAEVNECLAETEPGHLYLRYDVASGTPQEYWMQVGAHPRIARKSGQVTVPSI
ncbi:hypothetical protein [Deinococcus aestuarii]|uniref:hypothetical protein n=1 Tax=Deinococcus aestuarii TaxID=2774531 RepID=UPI001C0AB3FA|nr:hypothetical protein [Deinococcus aestuarii]